MKLICPSCGAIAGADAWTNDATIREFLGVLVKLPTPVGEIVLNYLSLFRPGARALTWKKALRITGELAALIGPGTVQVQGKVARPCPPRLWAMALEQMVERRETLQLPIKNHNYLKQIAYSLADQEDARGESMRNRAERSGNHRSYEPKGPEPLADDGLLPMEREMLKKGVTPPHLKQEE